jgi:hypothetical protein
MPVEPGGKRSGQTGELEASSDNGTIDTSRREATSDGNLAYLPRDSSTLKRHVATKDDASRSGSDTSCVTRNSTDDPRLSIVIEQWDRLPETTREAIEVMVQAAIAGRN